MQSEATMQSNAYCYTRRNVQTPNITQHRKHWTQNAMQCIAALQHEMQIKAQNAIHRAQCDAMYCIAECNSAKCDAMHCRMK
jgi:hypothetical protein